MRRRTSKAKKGREAHSQVALSEPFLSTDFNTVQSHPKAWVNKLCTDEGSIVLKGV